MSSASTPLATPEPLRFGGRSGEYFRIWIVNLALTLLTLGLYSPWAKVRKLRYLYGQTELAGSRFDYLANPWVILRGRLLAVALLVAYYMSGMISTGAEAVAFVLLLAALPWIISRGLAFRAAYSSWRSVRFGFGGGYGGALGVLYGWPLLNLLCAGLLTPLVDQRWRRYSLGRHRFGSTPFRLDAGLGRFYGIWLLLALQAVLLLILITALLGVLWGGLDADTLAGIEERLETGRLEAGLGFILPGLLLTAALVWLRAFYEATLNNHLWSHLRIADHRWHCRLRVLPLFAIRLSNLLGIVLSLGLLIPWATIRLARYRLEHMTLEVRGDLARLEAAQAERVGPAGEGLSQVLDLDLGF